MKNLNFLGDRYAFTLIEVLIYIALLAGTCVLFFGVFNKSLLNILNMNRVQNRELELALAIDILRRDLQAASMLPSDWEQSLFIFKKYGLNSKNKHLNTSIYWYIGKLGLMRAEGQYDFVKNIWQSKTAGLVCKNVSKIESKLKIDPKLNVVNNISLKILASKKSIHDEKVEEIDVFVRLRNRVLK